MELTTHPGLAPRLKKEYNYTSIPLLDLRSMFRVNFTYLTSLYSTYSMFILAVGDSFTASFPIRSMIATNLQLSFI